MTTAEGCQHIKSQKKIVSQNDQSYAQLSSVGSSNSGVWKGGGNWWLTRTAEVVSDNCPRACRHGLLLLARWVADLHNALSLAILMLLKSLDARVVVFATRLRRIPSIHDVSWRSNFADRAKISIGYKCQGMIGIVFEEWSVVIEAVLWTQASGPISRCYWCEAGFIGFILMPLATHNAQECRTAVVC